MLAKVVFAAVFLFLMGITIAVPSLSPAQLVYEYLKIPQTTISVWGLSVAIILDSLINSSLVVLIALTIYGITCFIIKPSQLPPMPVPPHLSIPPPEPMPVDTRPNTASPLITTSKKPVEMEPDIETINGIGTKYSGSLRNVGIKTVNDLLRAGATKYGRQNLANKVGVTYATLLKWVHRADLLRINGVGKKYSALLESAGVGTIKDLSLRNPIYLYQELKIVNNEQKLVKRTPPSKTIEIWVKSARNLKPIIEYKNEPI